MVLLSLSLAAVTLYVMSSGVLCDSMLRDEGTGHLMMAIPQLCVNKVNEMLKNVTVYCKGNDSFVDPLISDVFSLLQFERDKFKNCEMRLKVVSSLLEQFQSQLSQTKDRIRGMFGIVIRYQGNRTSLNDLLNRNHQHLLTTIDNVIREINSWRMNTSMWDVSYRDLDTLEECKSYLQETHKKFIDLSRDYQNSQKELKKVRDNNENCDNETLIQSLTLAEQKLKECSEYNTLLEQKSMKEEDYKDVLLDVITTLEKRLNESSDVHNNTKFEHQLESKLEECKNQLNVNTEDKETFHKAINLLKSQIVNETGSLFDSLGAGVTNASNSNTLLKEVRDKYEALRSVCQKFVEITRQKTMELLNCESENSQPGGRKKGGAESSLEACENEKYDLTKQLDIAHRKLRMLNETVAKQQDDLDEARMQKEQLIRHVNTVSEIAHKCNASLREQQLMSKKAEDLGTQLNWEEDRIRDLENDKRKLIEEVNTLRQEKEELLKTLKLTDSSLQAYKMELDNLKIQRTNYQLSCDEVQKNYDESLVQQRMLTEKLKESNEKNTILEIENVKLRSETDGCVKEKEELQSALIDKATEIEKCLGQKFNLTNMSEFKSRKIEELEYANMNLTSKLNEVQYSTSLNELDIKLRYLEYLLNNNRNEIKMLQEYGIILIMLVNKNAQLLNLVKDTMKNDEEGCATTDEKFDSLLRRLLRSVDQHHSRIYTQLIQMKPYMDKVIPIRVRRQVQRGRSADVALRMAAQEGNATEVGILLNVGVDVNTRDKSGITPLHCAAMEGHSDVAELLLCRGAQPNIPAPAKGLKTPLHLASVYGHLDTVVILLDYGADIEARAVDFATPLLYAANFGKPLVVRILLMRGANIRSTNTYNKNVYELGAKYPDVLHVLHEFTGADCDCQI